MPISWAERVWALPVLTVLAPSARFFESQGRQPQTMLERALQVLKVLKKTLWQSVTLAWYG
jgi:hypothetical protein